MEGLGVGSGGELWPCLAANTCEITDRSVLRVAKAFRETKPDAFEFIHGVCLSAAFSRSELLDFCRLPCATIGSLPASWRDGQPAQLLRAASARWPQVAMAVAFHSVAARTGEPRLREHLLALDAATPNCCQKRQMHLHSELLRGCLPGDLRRLTFDISGRRRAQPFDCPLDGRVRPQCVRAVY